MFKTWRNMRAIRSRTLDTARTLTAIHPDIADQCAQLAERYNVRKSHLFRHLMVRWYYDDLCYPWEFYRAKALRVDLTMAYERNKLPEEVDYIIRGVGDWIKPSFTQCLLDYHDLGEQVWADSFIKQLVRIPAASLPLSWKQRDALRPVLDYISAGVIDPDHLHIYAMVERARKLSIEKNSSAILANTLAELQSVLFKE